MVKKNPFIRNIKQAPSKPLDHQSMGILDDYAIRKNINTRSGTVEKVPVDESDIVNKGYVDAQATKSNIELFLTNNASDIGTYKDLEIDVITATEETITQAITANSTTLIASFASILNEDEINNLELLESGIYVLHIHASSNFLNNMKFYFEFYHRTAGGTETLLGTSHDSPVLTTGELEYNVHATITSDRAFVSGDRIVVKVYGRNDNAASKNITINMEGDTASRAEFPAFIAPGFVPAHTIASHSDTTATGTELDTLTGGGDTTLHDHDGISENTTHRQDNTQAHSDYLLNSAVDIGVGLSLTGDNASADTTYVPNVLYNTDATPPTASTVPIGTIYVQYTA